MNQTDHHLLDALATSILILDGQSHIDYLNPAAEAMLGLSLKNLRGLALEQVLPGNSQLPEAIKQAATNQATFIEHELVIEQPMRERLHLHCMVTPYSDGMLVELHAVGRPLQQMRDEQMRDQTQASRSLLRNLAHEIKNPLGGIRGAAQLLEQELERSELREYTQVVIHEADRLRALVDNLLLPHRVAQRSELNIHEVLERVRSVVLAEHPQGLTVRRDYDTSLPHLQADRAQLIQVVLNIVRNAVQAMQGMGTIVLRTRVARQVTLHKKRHRLALLLQIIDDGPGIPLELHDQIFYPLVSGRPDGHGLGLTIAQDFVSQHGGSIQFESEPGRTCFSVLLPLDEES